LLKLQLQLRRLHLNFICISAVNIISFYLKEIGDQVPRQVGQQAEVSSVEAFAPLHLSQQAIA